MRSAGAFFLPCLDVCTAIALQQHAEGQYRQPICSSSSPIRPQHWNPPMPSLHRSHYNAITPRRECRIRSQAHIETDLQANEGYWVNERLDLSRFPITLSSLSFCSTALLLLNARPYICWADVYFVRVCFHARYDLTLPHTCGLLPEPSWFYLRRCSCSLFFFSIRWHLEPQHICGTLIVVVKKPVENKDSISWESFLLCITNVATIVHCFKRLKPTAVQFPGLLKDFSFVVLVLLKMSLWSLLGS